MRLRAMPPISAIVTPGIIVAGFVFSLAANLPGHFSYDSVMQLWEGRTGSYNNWHPPVMAWLLGVFDALSPGAGLFVIFNSLLGFGSFAAILWLRPRPSWAAAAIAACAVLTPQLLIYEGAIWKDVLFADAGAAGFACLALAAAVWLKPRLRYGLIAAGFALLVLAALARQNGILMLIAGAGAIGWIAAKQAPQRRAMAAMIYGGGALFGALMVMMVANYALATHVDRDTADRQIVRLQAYDIIGALAAQPNYNLHEIESADPHLAEMLRSDGVRLYNPERSDTLLNSPALQSALLNTRLSLFSAQWRDLVLHHPWLYLRVRADVFRWVFLTPDLRLCVPYYVGIDGPPDEMAELGLKQRWDDRDQALDDYAENFVGTPILSHAFYAALAIAALSFLLWRRRPEDIAIAAMLGGALACTLSYFVISIACDYRYLYALDLSAMLAMFYLSLDRFGFLSPQK